eukprot:1175820-Prorocentrum_minimum.AAC.5
MATIQERSRRSPLGSQVSAMTGGDILQGPAVWERAASGALTFGQRQRDGRAQFWSNASRVARSLLVRRVASGALTFGHTRHELLVRRSATPRRAGVRVPHRATSRILGHFVRRAGGRDAEPPGRIP